MTNPLFEIKFDLAARRSRESSRTLYQQLRAAILDGRIAAGSKLPATRQSAVVFGVSRNTAVHAYERLLNDGYITSRSGSGTYVVDMSTARPSRSRTQHARPPPYALNGFWLRPEVTAAMGLWQDRLDQASGRTASQIDFRPALVDSRLFPFDTFRRVITKQLRALERKPARYKSPQGNQGTYSLRAAIARHIALTRAVVCDPDEVLVTS